MLSEVQNSRITVVCGVPTMYEKMKEIIANYDCSSVRYFISSGAPLPDTLSKYYKKNYGIFIINAYGSSETNTISITRDTTDTKEGSVGYLMPSIEIKIIDEHGQETKDNGEIIIKTPKMMDGYFHLPNETKNVLKNGWFHSGDIGNLSEESELFITGRKKKMLCVAGKKVYPSDVEETLMASGFFTEVMVEGMEDDQRGQAVKAALVLKKGLNINEKMILDYCRKTMASHKVPKEVEIMEKIDRSSTWKYAIAQI